MLHTDAPPVRVQSETRVHQLKMEMEEYRDKATGGQYWRGSQWAVQVVRLEP